MGVQCGRAKSHPDAQAPNQLVNVIHRYQPIGMRTDANDCFWPTAV